MADRRPFRERYPIAAPALEATYHFSKKQLLMNLVLSTIAIPVSIYLGLIPWFQIGATIKALLIVYLGLLLITAVYNFVRSPLRLLASNNERIAQLQERIAQLEQRPEPVSLLPAPAPQVKQEPLEPNIIYLSAEIVEAHRQHHGGIYEGRGPFINRRQEWFLACVVSFRNEVLKNREIGGRGLVSAKISYVFQEQAGSKTASRAAWFGTDRFHVTFGINDTHALVVATFEDWKLFAIQENASGGLSEDRTKKLPLLGDLHKVHIELISESESKVLCSTELILEITRKPELDIELRLES